MKLNDLYNMLYFGKLPQTDSFLKIKEILFLLHSKKLNYSTSM